MAVLKLIVQLQVDQTGGNEKMERIIENKLGEVKLEEVVPDDRSYFSFEVPISGKESAMRKVVFYSKVAISRATLTSMSGSVSLTL